MSRHTTLSKSSGSSSPDSHNNVSEEPGAIQPELLSAVLHIVSRVEGAIAPVPSLNGGGWVQFGAFRLMVFPFVEGVAGWNLRLTPAQWHQVGRTVRSLHDLVLPGPVADLLPREWFSGHWRDQARAYLTGERPAVVRDAPALAMQKLLQANRDLLFGILLQAEDLAAELSGRPHEVVCCHGDLHSGNFLVSDSGTAHPVDWDNLSLAPREKDWMFLGAGIGGMLDAPGAAALFFEGYGPSRVNVEALRYFRLERIVQDVVAYGQQLLDTGDGGDDRPVMLEQFSRQFEPGGVIDTALKMVHFR